MLGVGRRLKYDRGTKTCVLLRKQYKATWRYIMVDRSGLRKKLVVTRCRSVSRYETVSKKEMQIVNWVVKANFIRMLEDYIR